MAREHERETGGLGRPGRWLKQILRAGALTNRSDADENRPAGGVGVGFWRRPVKDASQPAPAEPGAAGQAQAQDPLVRLVHERLAQCGAQTYNQLLEAVWSATGAYPADFLAFLDHCPGVMRTDAGLFALQLATAEATEPTLVPPDPALVKAIVCATIAERGAQTYGELLAAVHTSTGAYPLDFLTLLRDCPEIERSASGQYALIRGSAQPSVPPHPRAAATSPKLPDQPSARSTARAPTEPEQPSLDHQPARLASDSAPGVDVSTQAVVAAIRRTLQERGRVQHYDLLNAVHATTGCSSEDFNDALAHVHELRRLPKGWYVLEPVATAARAAVEVEPHAPVAGQEQAIPEALATEIEPAPSAATSPAEDAFRSGDPEAIASASSQLKVGEVYSRAALQQKFQINAMSLFTGIFRIQECRSIWLFVTEDKSPDRRQYRDYLDGQVLEWDGQASGRTDDWIIHHRERSYELLLFYRRTKDEFPGGSFRYYGPVSYLRHEGALPAHFRLALLQPPRSSRPAVDVPAPRLVAETSPSSVSARERSAEPTVARSPEPLSKALIAERIRDALRAGGPLTYRALMQTVCRDGAVTPPEFMAALGDCPDIMHPQAGLYALAPTEPERPTDSSNPAAASAYGPATSKPEIAAVSPSLDSLAAKYPVLAAEFHPTRNPRLSAGTLSVDSLANVWWRCAAGHEWLATVRSRTQYGSDCRMCVQQERIASISLAVRFPDLAAQWHPTKNGSITPTDVRASSSRRAWWSCPDVPEHEWETTIVNRTYQRSGCPFCRTQERTVSPAPRPNTPPSPNGTGTIRPRTLVSDSPDRRVPLAVAPLPALALPRSVSGIAAPEVAYAVLTLCAANPRTREELSEELRPRQLSAVASIQFLQVVGLLSPEDGGEFAATPLGQRILSVLAEVQPERRNADIERGALLTMMLPQYRLAWECTTVREIIAASFGAAARAAAVTTLHQQPVLAAAVLRVAALVGSPTDDLATALEATERAPSFRATWRRASDLVLWKPGAKARTPIVAKSGFTELWKLQIESAPLATVRRAAAFRLLEQADRLPRVLFASWLSLQQLDLLAALIVGAEDEECLSLTTLAERDAARALLAIGVDLTATAGSATLGSETALIWDIGRPLAGSAMSRAGLSAAELSVAGPGAVLSGRALRALLPASTLAELRPADGAVSESAKRSALVITGRIRRFGADGDDIHAVLKLEGGAASAGTIRLDQRALDGERGRAEGVEPPWTAAVRRLPHLYLLALLLIEAGSPGVPELVCTGEPLQWRVGAGRWPLLVGLGECLRRLGLRVEDPPGGAEQQVELAEALVQLAVALGIAERHGNTLHHTPAFLSAMRGREHGRELRGETVALRQQLAEWLNEAAP